MVKKTAQTGGCVTNVRDDDSVSIAAAAAAAGWLAPAAGVDVDVGCAMDP